MNGTERAAERCYDRVGRLALTLTILLWVPVLGTVVFLAAGTGLAALGAAVGLGQ